MFSPGFKTRYTPEAKDIISALGWELLSHPPYSPDLDPFDYHWFSSISHELSMKHTITKMSKIVLMTRPPQKMDGFLGGQS